MKIVAISDTHNAHSELTIPECDILIHAGDESYRGNELEVRAFAKWLNQQPAKYKIWTPGNHSVGFSAHWPQSELWLREHCPDVHVLIHSAVVLDGVKIWGSPATPWFHNWAYNFHRGPDIRQIWGRIPADTSIVVTHGPPHGILDETTRHQRVGCEDLAKRISQVKPKYHIFGHIHEAYGTQHILGTTYVNAAIMDEDYDASNLPVELAL